MFRYENKVVFRGDQQEQFPIATSRCTDFCGHVDILNTW